MPNSLHAPTVTTFPIDPPVGGEWCRNCSDPIVATAKVFDGGMTIGGLRQYQWTHEHGSDICRPTTVAQPYDGWRATKTVEATLRAREAAEDALAAALESEGTE